MRRKRGQKLGDGGAEIITVAPVTLQHIKRRHPEIMRNDYHAVQTLLDSGVQISDRKDSIGIAGWHEGKGYVIAVSKPNHPLGANQLVTLYSVGDKKLKKMIKKAKERTAGSPT